MSVHRDDPPPQENTEPENNTRAMPPPVFADRPGPSDWMNKNGPVCDGDYVTFRCNAWKKGNTKGIRIRPVHASGEVRGDKFTTDQTNIDPVRMDNGYAFVIRRIVFDGEKKAFVLPSWKAWKDRTPIATNDTVVFLVPNDPWRAMGTRNPSNAYSNNGDYRVELVDFPLATKDTLQQNTITGHAARIVSLGFWNGSRNSVDFLNQSRCVWTFHNVGTQSARGVLLGGTPINIRNLWTDIKSKETSIWQAAGGLAPGLIGTAIQRNFSGGRNLTLAAGSDGNVVKLALHNNDTDDKAGWIIDAWYGNRYPVQRALIPETPPPPRPEGEAPPPPGEPTPPIVVPDLTDQIRNPPPPTPGMTYDARTGTNIHTELEKKTQAQNPETWLDTIAKAFYGKRWNAISYFQQLTIAGLIAAGVIVVADETVKVTLNKVL